MKKTIKLLVETTALKILCDMFVDCHGRPEELKILNEVRGRFVKEIQSLPEE